MPIVFEKVSHTYMEKSALSKTALHNVSLSISEGEFIGIIGKTGSGKSTLLQHINSLLLPTEGSITVDGLDTQDKNSIKKIRSLVGMVFQYPEYQLFEETVEKDISFGPKNMGMTPEEQKESARNALEMVGLDPERFLPLCPFDLSGGEKRRVALAGILSMSPKYLVLDEPMAGLDPMGRNEILELLNNLRKKTGCAVIMVSHSMDDIAKYADRIFVIHDGELQLTGKPTEVFSNIDKLKSFGVSVPQSTKLASLLKQRGIPVDSSVVTMDGLLKSLLKEAFHAK